jgi:hypothetical protein
MQAFRETGLHSPSIFPPMLATSLIRQFFWILGRNFVSQSLSSVQCGLVLFDNSAEMKIKEAVI